MKKNCELCERVARTRCESDQADLCWTCDYRVHTANFLVARHSRTLLCHVCQSTTPWSATGTRLGPTVSVCNNCVRNCGANKGIIAADDAEYEEEYEGSEVGVESDSSSDVGVETSSDDDDNDEEADNEDNQVVPWSPTTPPPAVSSSSNSDGESYTSSSSSSRRDRRKRTHENVSDLRLNANQNRSSNRGNASSPPVIVAVTGSPAAACDGGERVRCERNLKRRRFDSNRVGHLSPNSIAAVESIKTVQRQEMQSSAAVAEFCRLSED